MKILIACEFSGIVRDAFITRGHDAVSCDFLPTERPGPHYVMDVLEVLDDGWDMMIAFPPCTYLCNSGVRWLHESNPPNRWELMEAGARFFKSLLDARIRKKAIENPTMHKYAVKIIGRRADQFIQPWQFGHPESKRTGLYLENLPPLEPTNIVNGREGRVHKESPGPDRWKRRSKAYQGIANAMADQWE